MKYYFAPLEGITGYVYRNAHHKFFPGTDRYYTPFVAPNYTKHFKTKEKRDVAPANNAGVPQVPQVPTPVQELAMLVLKTSLASTKAQQTMLSTK